jgi:hypothetical protein
VSFWLLCSPYTLYVDRDEAAIQAARATGLLERAGVPVFSPILKGHALVEHAGFPIHDPELWRRINAPFVAAAKGGIVLRLNGWRESVGIYEEREEFARTGRPVIFMDPGKVPEEIVGPPNRTVAALQV